MADRRERSQLFGEFLREGAVLIAVLYPLETIISVQFDAQRQIEWWHIVIAEVIAGILLWWGIILEGSEEL
ncbi:MAG: hypothetical protein WA655_05115 [Candidatus Korobacteraceae bacterium]